MNQEPKELQATHTRRDLLIAGSGAIVLAVIGGQLFARKPNVGAGNPTCDDEIGGCDPEDTLPDKGPNDTGVTTTNEVTTTSVEDTIPVEDTVPVTTAETTTTVAETTTTENVPGTVATTIVEVEAPTTTVAETTTTSTTVLPMPEQPEVPSKTE